MKHLQRSAEQAGLAFYSQLLDFQNRQENRRPEKHKRANRSGRRSAGSFDQIPGAAESRPTARTTCPLRRRNFRQLMNQSAAVAGFELAQEVLTLENGH